MALTFDDVSKLSGTATATSVHDESTSDSGTAIAELLREQTGVIWAPIDTSGHDYKNEWTSTQTRINRKPAHRVEFKIYP